MISKALPFALCVLALTACGGITDFSGTRWSVDTSNPKINHYRAGDITGLSFIDKTTVTVSDLDNDPMASFLLGGQHIKAEQNTVKYTVDSSQHVLDLDAGIGRTYLRFSQPSGDRLIVTTEHGNTTTLLKRP